MRNTSLSDQVEQHMINKEVALEIERVEAETIELAAQACKEACLEIGAMPGSSIHSALVLAADKIRAINK